METSRVVSDCLQEMRNSARCVTDDESYRAFLGKYDTFLGGENRCVVFSHEVFKYLEENNMIDIDLDGFLQILPTVCEGLGMKVDRLIAIEDIDKGDLKATAYQITLF